MPKKDTPLETIKSPADNLRSELESIHQDASAFFVEIKDVTAQREALDSPQKYMLADWNFLTDEQQRTANRLRKRVIDFGGQLMELATHSPLLEAADSSELRIVLRTMSASLLLRHYSYQESYAISEQDKVYGVQPAEHTESKSTVEQCEIVFRRSFHRVGELIDLIAPNPDKLASAIMSSHTPSVQKYRPNTAFIMMQISDAIPTSEDIKNTIKDVFTEFGIEAVRSDEIEHSGVITQRILDEIATSEFLIADLTGERPSVYYEVGYAHALGKRPILYREKGAALHFDLLVHNVPEYRNATDLKAQLRKRLAALTNRKILE